jgi:hypothetical protein
VRQGRVRPAPARLAESTIALKAGEPIKQVGDDHRIVGDAAIGIAATGTLAYPKFVPHKICVGEYQSLPLPQPALR